MPDEITFKPRTAANRHVEDQATIDALRARVAELEEEQAGTDSVFLAQATSIKRYREALERIEDLDPNKNTLHDAINIAYTANHR